MINEHFGVAVVEGMAAGLIPVVHKSGGPWFDIIDRGRYGYGYSDVESAVKVIDEALNNYDKLKNIVIKRALLFDKAIFIEKIKKIIKKIEDTKKNSY